MHSGKSLWMLGLSIGAWIVCSGSITGCALTPLDPEVSEDEQSALGEAEAPLDTELVTDQNQGVDTGEGNDPEPNPWHAHDTYRTRSTPGPDPNVLLSGSPKGTSKKHDE